jgi:hypothetical protein
MGPVRRHDCPACGRSHPDERQRERLPDGKRTPGTSDWCEYAGCHHPALGELRAHYSGHPLPWSMCADHIRPAAHPSDLRRWLVLWR